MEALRELGQGDLHPRAPGGGGRGRRAGRGGPQGGGGESQAPALPYLLVEPETATPCQSLTSLIWKMGPRGTTPLRQVVGADRLLP